MPRLEDFQAYLQILATSLLRKMQVSQFDPMDLVQETFTRAQLKWNTYQGTTDKQLAAWLRAILTNHLFDLLRRNGWEADEQGMRLELDASSARLEEWLACEELTPRRKSLKNELMSELSRALIEMPADQRSAVEMRYLSGLSITEICQRMDRSPASVGGLLQRGLVALRSSLSNFK
jgi:RNA polymerase sigma-70 factor, ECF subfamily